MRWNVSEGAAHSEKHRYDHRADADCKERVTHKAIGNGDGSIALDGYRGR